MTGTNVSAFVDGDGNVDEQRVRQNLGVLFGSGSVAPQPKSWGQHGTGSFSSAPGDQGRAEAQRRAERNGQAGTPAGAEALRRMPGQVQNAGAAEARRRAQRASGPPERNSLGAGGTGRWPR